MKEGWETRSLGHLVDILDHKRKPITKRHRESGEFPYYGATGVLDYVADYLFDEPLVLVGEDGAKWEAGANTAFAVKGKIWVNNHAHVLRPHRNHLLDNWLIYYLNHSDLQTYVTGLTVPKLNQGSLREIPIPLPPLPEQKRIVKILDEAFAAIATAKANTEKNLQNTRAVFDSYLNSVFTQRGEGWDGAKLKDITTKIGSGATPRGGEKSYKSDGISLIRSMNVHDFGFQYRKLTYLDDVQGSELLNVEVKKNDVLLNITGASVARCCVVPEDVLPARVNQHVSIIRPIAEKLHSKFLHYLLISKPYKEHLLQTGQEGGSTRQAITKAQIQDFVIHFTESVEEQQRIVTTLDALLAETQHLESIYSQKLTALAGLKKSLLYQAFSGGI